MINLYINEENKKVMTNFMKDMITFFNFSGSSVSNLINDSNIGRIGFDLVV